MLAERPRSSGNILSTWLRHVNPKPIHWLASLYKHRTTMQESIMLSTPEPQHRNEQRSSGGRCISKILKNTNVRQTKIHAR